MDELSKRLAKAKVIGLDTPVFIYFLEDNPRYGALLKSPSMALKKGNGKE